MKKRNTENDPPYSDGPQRDYHKAEHSSKQRLISRIIYLEDVVKNLAVMHDGRYHGTTIFNIKDKDFLDKGDES